MKKLFIYISLSLLLTFGIIYTAVEINPYMKPVATDSGWDSSYDSGGSDWSSSDWSSSDWSSSDSDYSSSDIKISHYILSIAWIVWLLICCQYFASDFIINILCGFAAIFDISLTIIIEDHLTEIFLICLLVPIFSFSFLNLLVLKMNS